VDLVQHHVAISEASESPVAGGLAGDWLTPRRFASFIGLLIFCAFPEVLLGSKTFVVRDFGFFAYPLAHFQRECFWHGQLPFWNPYNNCGVPFLAQWNTMPLYPPSLIYLTLPLTWSLSLFCLLHLFFAGMGMYLLARRWTGNNLGASVAGVVFAFNGLSLNMLMWPSHVATLSWMPWVVLTVERAWQLGGRKLIIAALAASLQMLAGGPETILLTWLFLSGLWVLEMVRSRASQGVTAGMATAGTGAKALENPRAKFDRPPPQILWWSFPVVVLLVAGLTALQLLPFLDLATHSQRDQGYADTRWSMPGSGWANFLVPMVFGRIWNMGVFFQTGQAWTSSYYLGTGSLLLILFAIWTVRSWRTRFLTVATGLSLLMAFGDHAFLYRWLRLILPQLSLVTYPVKFVTVLIFTAPLLAAFGIVRLQSSPLEKRLERRLLVLGIILLMLIGAILVWAWRAPFPTDNFAATLRNGLSRGGFLIGAMALLVVVGRASPKPAIQHASSSDPGELTDRGAGSRSLAAAWRHIADLKTVLPALVLLLFWLDVVTHEPTQNPAVTPEVYQPGLIRAKLAMHPQPELGQSRAMIRPSAEMRFMQFTVSNPRDNFLVKRLGYFANCNLLDNVPKVNGFFSLYPREGGELVSALYGSTNADFPRLADFMSVSQITAAGKFFDWNPRETFLPMITAGQRPVFLDDMEGLRALFSPGFDGQREVILSSGEREFVTARDQTAARVVSSRFGLQQAETEVEAPEPSLVVFSQTYYHRWRAYVDGQPTRLLRANYAFQAVQVPAGRHRVLLVYEDRAFFVGAIISGISTLLSLAIWIRCSGRRSSSETSR